MIDDGLPQLAYLTVTLLFQTNDSYSMWHGQIRRMDVGMNFLGIEAQIYTVQRSWTLEICWAWGPDRPRQLREVVQDNWFFGHPTSTVTSFSMSTAGYRLCTLYMHIQYYVNLCNMYMHIQPCLSHVMALMVPSLAWVVFSQLGMSIEFPTPPWFIEVLNWRSAKWISQPSTLLNIKQRTPKWPSPTLSNRMEYYIITHQLISSKPRCFLRLSIFKGSILIFSHNLCASRPCPCHRTSMRSPWRPSASDLKLLSTRSCRAGEGNLAGWCRCRLEVSVSHTFAGREGGIQMVAL